MERWYVDMKKADFNAIAEKFQISPIVARLIHNRDVIGDESIQNYLNGTIADLHDGMLMRDMDRAVEILSEKIREKASIRIIGDYDIDGVSATYILQEGLSGLGADVDTDIPDRVKDGYGLNQTMIDRALEEGIDTIITCDNGIAASMEIAYGKKHGMTIIVTDHHQVPYEEKDGEKQYLLPQADAVVDPHRPDCEYPFKGLCGAAVAYKLVEALYEVMQRDADEVDYLMENVAIATIGDVMELKDENRIFVKQGLEMLKKTSNKGLRALMECTGIPIDELNVYHIGFVIGPCINASGRLDTAKRALDLLNAENRRDAVMMAEDLKALNDSRKEMTEKGVQQAIELIEGSTWKNDHVLVVYLPDCHESIAGIIAGRIREQYYRPTFVLTIAEDGVKGSGRSIDSYNMFEELCKCRDLLTRFGGHRQAAGVSMKEDQIELFRQRLNELEQLTEEDMIEKVKLDMQLPLPYIREELVEQMKLLEPYGVGNPKPLFAERNLKVERPQILGKDRNVLKFRVKDERGNEMDAIYFGDVEECFNQMQENSIMTFAFVPTINEYMGRRTIQLNIQHYK